MNALSFLVFAWSSRSDFTSKSSIAWNPKPRVRFRDRWIEVVSKTPDLETSQSDTCHDSLTMSKSGKTAVVHKNTHAATGCRRSLHCQYVGKPPRLHRQSGGSVAPRHMNSPLSRKNSAPRPTQSPFFIMVISTSVPGNSP